MELPTRDRLLLEAEGIVRRHGYADFSYADLAAAIGLRKASIHHHFPAKEDLGLALVETYTARFAVSLAGIVADLPDAPARLRSYAGLYRAGLASGQGCLCGVLAAELAGLPPAVRAGVRRFFTLHLDWLSSVLTDGQRADAIRRDATPAAQASVVLAGLQGAMLIAQAVGAVTLFDTTAGALLAGLQP